METPSMPRSKGMNTALDICCGGAGSCFACLFTNPLDVMRTRMQVQGDLCKQGTYERHYRNVPQGLLRVAREEGLGALQKGLRPSILWQFTQNGLRIGLYPVFKQGFQTLYDTGKRVVFGPSRRSGSNNKSGEENFLVCLCSGASSGAVGSFCASPFILVKTRLQSQRSPMEKKIFEELKKEATAAGGSRSTVVSSSTASTATTGVQHQYRGILDAIKTIYQAGGITALWHGSRTAVKRTMVGSSTQLLCYDYVSRLLIGYGNRYYPITTEADKNIRRSWTAKDPKIHFTAALLSSVAVVMCMNPFEVVMTRTYNRTAADTAYADTLRSSLVKVYRTEGLSGCYKGAGPMLARFAPHTVITFVVYEYLKEQCGLTPKTG